jgi:alkaline phosphatase
MLIKKIILGLAMVSTLGVSVPLEKVEEGFAENVSGVTLARWIYNDGEPLYLDEMAAGLVRTYNSDTPIADSAPGGTALSTGIKTQDKLIAIRPKIATLYGTSPEDTKEPYAPIASVLELAKLQGKSIGIISTSEVMHATPADFTAHAEHRSQYDIISEQLVYQNLDVVFGGGEKFLLEKNRKDGKDMYEELKERGYSIIRTKKELENQKNSKVWGIFANADMPYEIDRRVDEPSLADMTRKAIEILSKNPKGFVLMVEGSKVDWAAHANSPATIVKDIKAFDDAVGEALSYAKSNKKTLIISSTDHGNSGISIGDESTAGNYPQIPLGDFTSTIKKVNMGEEKLSKLIFEDMTKSVELIEKHLGFTPTKEEVEKINEVVKNFDSTKTDYLRMRNSKTQADEIRYELGRMIARRSKVGFTTTGHTGEDVPLYVYASDYKNQLTGVVQNTDVAKYTAKAINGSLEEATKELFVSSKIFTKEGILLEKNIHKW